MKSNIGTFLCCLFLLTFCSVSAIELPPNYQISSPNDWLQYGENILMHPTETQTIISVWRDFRTGNDVAIGRSTDGGQTWSESFVSPSQHIFDRLSDPSITYDNSGNLYITMKDYQADNPSDSSHITILKSSDGGVTWPETYTVSDTIGHYFEWDQATVIDNTGGPNSGNIYIAWVRNSEDDGPGNYGPNSIMFSKSTDGGLSFVEPIVVGPPIDVSSCSNIFGNYIAAGDYPSITVGSDGSIYIFWKYVKTDDASISCVMSQYCFKMVKSSDGGVTWSEVQHLVENDLMYKTIDGDITINGAPNLASDISGGSYDGNLYMTYTGLYDFDIYDSDYNIEFIKSTDGGITWSTPIYINDDYIGPDATFDQFHPNMVCSEDGVIIIAFYDQRTDPVNHSKFDVFAAYSFDGGNTFTQNHRISNISIDPDLMINAGDTYFKVGNTIGLSSRNNRVCAAWTDTRNGNQDVFGASWDIPLLTPTLIAPANNDIVCETAILEWSPTLKHDDDQYLIQVADDSQFENIVVSETVNEPILEISTTGLTSGNKYWRVKATKISTGELTEHSETSVFYYDNDYPPVPLPYLPLDGINVSSLPTLEWYQMGDPPCPVFYDLEISTSYTFSSDILRYNNLTETSLTLVAPLQMNVPYYWHVLSKNSNGVNNYHGPTASFTIVPFVCGDVSHEDKGDINILDIIYLINNIYKDGPAIEPTECGDVNSDYTISILDVVYLINFLYKEGPDPVCPNGL